MASYTAELGGKVRDTLSCSSFYFPPLIPPQAPILIFSDSDIQSAVNGAAFASFVASGQTCVSGTRLIVQTQIYDAFLERFLAKVQSIRRRMGDPLNPKSSMGSVISAKHLERIEGMVGRTRGEVIAGGGGRMIGKSELDGFDFSKGSFYPPTVITDIEVEDELWQEEVFGPVVVVKRFTVSSGSTTLSG